MPPDTLVTKFWYVGLDLGQLRNHSAIAGLEVSEWEVGERSPVTYERTRETRYWVRVLERIPLDTQYPDVVWRVGQITRAPELAGRCTLLVDKTGVGAAVVDALRRGGLGCLLQPVTITGGESVTRNGDGWNVPKKDLVQGMWLWLMEGKLGIAKRLEAAEALVQELISMRVTVSDKGRESFGAKEGEQDDLALALSLACWGAQRGQPVGGRKGRLL